MSSPEATEAEAVEAGATDELREALLDEVRSELGDALVGTHVRPGDDVWIRVTREAWQEAGLMLRDRAGFRAFEFLSAIDWMPSPFGKGEDSPTDLVGAAEATADAGDDAGEGDEAEGGANGGNDALVTGYAGGDTRFQVFARAHSLSRKMGITVKVDLPDHDLSLATWIPVFAGANWHERETREMFGITFVGHPHPVNIYLPGEFEGHPLRKDFPLLARHVKPWPGIVDIEPMPGDAAAEDGDEAQP